MKPSYGLLAVLGAVPLALAAAPTAAPALDSRPALATGASSDPAARFRLERRRLTVTLVGRLTQPGFKGRPSVRIVCGDSVKDPATNTAFHWSILASRGERSLRVAPGTRAIRARLDADVAASANWCGVRWRSRDGNHFLSAVMTLRHGVPPGCALVPPAEALVDTDRLLVTRTRGRSGGQFNASTSALRACAKPAGAWRPLGASSGDMFGAATTWLRATAGTLAVTTQSAQDRYFAVYPCPMRLFDVSRPTAPPIAVPTAPGEDVDAVDRVDRSKCAHQVALTPTGRMAWTTGVYPQNGSREPDEINVRTEDGRVTTLATGAVDSLRDPAITADGTTVTWREAGVARSAPMP